MKKSKLFVLSAVCTIFFAVSEGYAKSFFVLPGGTPYCINAERLDQYNFINRTNDTKALKYFYSKGYCAKTVSSVEYSNLDSVGIQIKDYRPVILYPENQEPKDVWVFARDIAVQQYK